MLRRAGFEVQEAPTGAEGLAAIERTRPDLVLLDHVLPDIEGPEVCRRVRSNPAFANVFIVLISAGRTAPEEQVSALEGGADVYLTRPIGPRELVAQIGALMRIRANERHIRESEALWRGVFELAGDGIVILNHQWTVSQANPEASRMFECPPARFAGSKITHWCAADQRAVLEELLERTAGGSSAILPIAWVGAQGTVVQTEVNSRGFPARLEAAHVLIVRDLTERLASVTREMRGLTDYSESAPGIAAAMYGLSPLASRADGEFARMVLSYQEALSSAVERREFRGAEPASSKLRSIADALGYQRAGPRDLVAIHTLALRNKLETVPAGRKQIYIEEARFTVLELMGYLLAHYRNQAIGSKAARE